MKEDNIANEHPQQLEYNFQKHINMVKSRLTKYTFINLADSTFPVIALFTTKMYEELEKVFEKLREEPSQLSIISHENNLQEIHINDFSMYFTSTDGKYFIYCIESKDNNSFVDLMSVLSSFRTIKNRHLVNDEIRSKLLESFCTAKKKVCIVSPWISDYVVNPSFRKLIEGALKKGITIKILYGIQDSYLSGNKKSDKTDNIANELKCDFNRYGNLFKMKKTNTHYKLLICDDLYYVQGSYNYLSFDGNYDKSNVRSEGAEYIEDPQMVRFLKEKYFNF